MTASYASAAPDDGAAASLSDPMLVSAAQRAFEDHSYGRAKDARFQFVADGGRELSVRLWMEPVYDLRRGVEVAVYAQQEVRDLGTGVRLDEAGRARLKAADMEKLDCESFRHALQLFAGDGAHGGPGVAQTAWRTLAASRSRFEMLNACLQTSVATEQRVLTEIVDLDLDVVDPDRLADVAGMLTMHRKAVIVQAPADPNAMTVLGKVGVQGVSLHLSALPLCTAAGWADLSEAIQAAAQCVGAVLLVGLRPDRAATARAAGATHAVFSTLSPLRV